MYLKNLLKKIYLRSRRKSADAGDYIFAKLHTQRGLTNCLNSLYMNLKIG
ncbi:hypothetical protein PILCRDRAFT_659806 [Piloderma croceum F 1598]|uniref:Uncharacterized protein n=1 Tax=Piloderma croceum (strain F 1598) TaxID=765440 RepID=A0A0C3F7Q8_PILCF|nr:hypothetical protein PILCRDRAFT_659806 [Piloderma croceum F 1598]